MNTDEVTAEQRQKLEHDGWFVIDDFFSPADTGAFAEMVRKTIRSFLAKAAEKYPTADLTVKPGDEFDYGTQLLSSIDHDFLAQVYDTICFSPEFLRLSADPRIARVMNSIYGRELDAPLYVYKNRCRIDPPRDNRRISSWHQEVFSGIPEAGPFLKTWSPLIHDSHHDNGTLHVASGSHEKGIVPQSRAEIPGRVIQIVVDQDYVSQYEECLAELKVGQLLVFWCTTIHSSGDNVSDQTRYSFVSEYYNVDDPNFVAPQPRKPNFRNMSLEDYYKKVANTW